MGRGFASWYQQTPWWVTVPSSALIPVLGGLVARSGGYAPQTTALVLAAAVAVGHLGLRARQFTATSLVLVLAMGLTPPAALLYAVAAAGENADPAGAVFSMLALMALAALLAHRTSRGRPWVTVLLVVGAVTFAGPLLLALYPGLGFGWAWVTTAAVLIARAGLAAWVWGLPRRALARLRAGRAAQAPAAGVRDAAAAAGGGHPDAGPVLLPGPLSPEQEEALGVAAVSARRGLNARVGGGSPVSAWTVEATAPAWSAGTVSGYLVAGVPVVGYSAAGACTISGEDGFVDAGQPRNELLVRLLAAARAQEREAQVPGGVSTSVDTLVVAVDAPQGCDFKTGMVLVTEDSGTEVVVALADMASPRNLTRAVSMAFNGI